MFRAKKRKNIYFEIHEKRSFWQDMLQLCCSMFFFSLSFLLHVNPRKIINYIGWNFYFIMIEFHMQAQLFFSFWDKKIIVQLKFVVNCTKFIIPNATYSNFYLAGVNNQQSHSRVFIYFLQTRKKIKTFDFS